MTVYLSKEERQLVGKYSKKDRPTYFSAAAERELPISGDMEDFIILATTRGRNAVVNWIKDSNTKTKDKQDRETLLKEALESDQLESRAQLAEANKGLDNYTQMVDNYFDNVIPEDSGSVGTQLQPKRTRFADVPEVGQALSDMSRSVEEFLVVQERAKHLEVATKVLSERLARGSISKNEKRQIESWATPFTAYTNGRR